MDGDSNYFTRRANEERTAATKAAHPKARSAHLKMAEGYDRQAGAPRDIDAFHDLDWQQSIPGE